MTSLRLGPVVGALVLLVSQSSCTKQNPASCADGTCDDPSRRFCDVDGSWSGDALTCVAVTCTPGEFAGCRDEKAYVCDPMGSSFDTIQCPFGCADDLGGCRECSSNSHCDNPTPVCDAQRGACRACIAAEDCESHVCDETTGSCLASSEVVYASPLGIQTGDCTADAPCEIQRAVDLARVSSTRRTVRLAVGRYATNVQIPSGSVELVGESGVVVLSRSTASAPLTESFSVGDGATVTLRGITVDLTESSLKCQGGAAVARLSIVDGGLDAQSAANTRVTVSRCEFSLERSTARTNGMSISDHSVFVVDRVRFKRVNGAAFAPTISFTGTTLDVLITNSIFDDVRVNGGPQDSVAGNSKLRVSFVSMWTTDALALACQVQYSWVPLIENSIIVSSGQAVTGEHCTFHRVLFGRQTVVPPGDNLTGDPLFVDASNGDFRLQVASPAIDSASASGDIDVSHDFDGVARPQGAAADIGAYERVP